MFDPFLHIDDYKEGKLTAEQVALFEHALSDNEDLQKIINNYDEAKRLSEGLVEIETRQILEKVRNEKAVPENSVIKYLWPFFAVAALVMGFILLSQVFQKPVTGEELFAEYFDPESASFSVKSSSSDSLLLIAETLFNRKKYAEAVIGFEEYTESSGQRNNDVTYFQALSNLGSEKLPESISLFNSLPDTYNTDVLWYKALIDLKQNNIEGSLNKLARIPESSAYYERAMKLAHELSSIKKE